MRSVLRTRPVDDAASAAGTAPRRSLAIELAWTVIPAIVLALVLALTWRAIHAPSSGDGAPRDTVVGAAP